MLSFVFTQEGTQIFYIHIGLADFLGFKILNFNIFCIFFRKYDYFWGLEIFVDIFWDRF